MFVSFNLHNNNRNGSLHFMNVENLTRVFDKSEEQLSGRYRVLTQYCRAFPQVFGVNRGFTKETKYFNGNRDHYQIIFLTAF